MNLHLLPSLLFPSSLDDHEAAVGQSMNATICSHEKYFGRSWRLPQAPASRQFPFPPSPIFPSAAYTWPRLPLPVVPARSVHLGRGDRPPPAVSATSPDTSRVSSDVPRAGVRAFILARRGRGRHPTSHRWQAAADRPPISIRLPSPSPGLVLLIPTSLPPLLDRGGAICGPTAH